MTRAWQKAFEQYVDWDQEFLLVVNELEHAVSICKIVDNDSLCEHIVSDASHLYCIFYLLLIPEYQRIYCFDTRQMLQDGSARVTVWDMYPLFHYMKVIDTR